MNNDKKYFKLNKNNTLTLMIKFTITTELLYNFSAFTCETTN